MSQRARILAVIALAALPLVALVGLRIWQEYEEDKARVVAERLARVRTAAFAAQLFIDSQAATARAIASHPALAAGRSTPELESFLQRVAEQNAEWAGIGVARGDGYTILGTRGEPAIYVGDRAYFKLALERGAPVVSSAIIGRRTGLPTIVVAAGFELSAGGRGVLLVPLPTARFGRELLSKIDLPGAEVAVIDAEAQTFIHTDAARVARLASVRGDPAAQGALRGESGSLSRNGTLVVYAPVAERGWGVLVSEPAQTAFATARRKAAEHLLLLAGALALVSAIGWILGGRLSAAYEHAAQARAQAERALRTRDEFLAAASHDLRNPLATIRASAELLAQSLARGGALTGERLAACVAHIERASRRMGVQIDGFLDLARLQMGAPLELALAPVDLAALVRQLAEEARELSTRHRMSLSAPPALAVRGDPTRLARAIGNLLQNAIKYSPEGGEIRLELARSEDGTQALLSVADRGIGIPPEDLERVFERFERGSNVVGRIGGTGIGLAGARQIIEQHGGTISVASRVGEGTVFTVRLPAQGEAAAPATDERRAA